MSTTIGGTAHGAGSNHGNAGLPDLPMEKRERETPDEFRARMDAKAERLRKFVVTAKRATRSVSEAITDEGLEEARFEEPELVAEEPEPKPQPAPQAPMAVPKPTPPAVRAPRPSTAAQRHARWVDAYVIDGKSTTEIGAEQGVSGSAVGQALKKAGVQTRPRGGVTGAHVPREPGPKPDPIRPCAGTCGRMTRPGNIPAADAPDAVFRARAGMCFTCARHATDSTATVGRLRKPPTTTAPEPLPEPQASPAPVTVPPPDLDGDDVRHLAAQTVRALLDAAAALAEASRHLATLTASGVDFLDHLDHTELPR